MNQILVNVQFTFQNYNPLDSIFKTEKLTSKSREVNQFCSPISYSSKHREDLTMQEGAELWSPY